MNKLERINSLPELLRLSMQGWQSDLWTAIPGYITKYDAVAKTCEVKPALSVRIKNPQYGTSGFTGTAYDYVELPILLDCPVHFPSGGGYTLSFPVAVGDECLVIFSSRSIDNWWAQGGYPQVQRAENTRMHNLSDGIAFVGISSVKSVTPNLSTNSVQLRSHDGSTFVEIKTGDVNINAQVKVTVTAPTLEANVVDAIVNASAGATVTAPAIILNGNVTINGTLTQTGGGVSSLSGVLNVVGEITGNGKALSTHRHSGIQAGISNTGTPI